MSLVNQVTALAQAVAADVKALSTDKQETLVSGTNIKTVGGVSLLGEGNVDAASWTNTTTATSKTIVVNERVTVTAAAQTITLPASPVSGDEVTIVVGDFDDTQIAGNGKQILGKAGPAVVNLAFATAHLFYNGTDWRFA